MSIDQISFSCDACGVQLKVPASLAGITGPCPSCQASITAPAPEPLAPDFSAAPPPPEPQHEPQPVAVPEPATVSSIPESYATPSSRPSPSSPNNYELPAPRSSSAPVATAPYDPPYDPPSAYASGPPAVDPFANPPAPAPLEDDADFSLPKSTAPPEALPSPAPLESAPLESPSLAPLAPLLEPEALPPLNPSGVPNSLASTEPIAAPAPPLPQPTTDNNGFPAPLSANSPEAPAPTGPLLPHPPANHNGFPAPLSANGPEAPAPTGPLLPHPPATTNGFPAPLSANSPEAPAPTEPLLPHPPATTNGFPAPVSSNNLEALAAPEALPPSNDFPAPSKTQLPASFSAPENHPEPAPPTGAVPEDELPPVLLSNPIEPDSSPGFPEPAFPPPPSSVLETPATLPLDPPSSPSGLSAMPGPVPAALPTPSAPFPEPRPAPQDIGFPPSPPVSNNAPAPPTPTPIPLPAAGGSEDAFSKLIPIGAPTPATPEAPTTPHEAKSPALASAPPIGPLSPGDPPTVSKLAPSPVIAPGSLADRIPEPPKKRRRLRWPSVVFPILFLLLAGIVVYLVLDLTGIVNSASHTPPEKESPSTAKAKPRPALRANTNATPVNISNDHKRPNPKGIEQHDLSADGELPPTPLIDLDSTTLPTSPSARITSDPNNPSNILEKFLRAQSLEERLPYMTKSRLTAEELATSSLASPLPEIVNRRSVHYMENRSERHKEHFFEVFFQMAANERAVPILIQLNDWGDGKVQVHTDAFLDLFEDNIGKFGESPVDGPRTFHVVADAYKHCFDDIVPAWDRKSVLKLRTHPRMAPRLIAYFNRNSAISDEISKPQALPWGESGVCTVTVEWNTDTPGQPFVELRRINGFTWNP